MSPAGQRRGKRLIYTIRTRFSDGGVIVTKAEGVNAVGIRRHIQQLTALLRRMAAGELVVGQTIRSRFGPSSNNNNVIVNNNGQRAQLPANVVRALLGQNGNRVNNNGNGRRVLVRRLL